ncbi:fused response regulator/phosphatase [Exilibacterium tricleocarpae]|uniref:Fused response regulator/phosphatase n=1 Tax=Exilibacterium tricleocarpae TaxID=2591008 RepID=A0A545U3Y6_9GAMM|nr:fused response regulator/phosphatase [Exilibacterium tricleocarpae]TQV84179.1 fused response regulator/phosphatase [Exilibacterium tricleocarpae]
MAEADKTGLKVLVADDTDTDRMILESIVKKEGHRVIGARDGLEAVEAYERERPDIVLLDALMPKLDGFGAARQIKALAGEELVPIIFLTSLTDTESLVQCLDAGGDDFLSKPYNRFILQAKIKAFYRMREMHATMLTQRDQIVLHNEHLLQEQTVAKQVFDNIAHTGCLDASNVKHYLSPLAVFNGDVLVAAVSPSGSMMVLLGDFTGHGLPAAIGAMPLATTFYGMAHKGFSLTDILREINQKLKNILPVGVFCCATMVDINFRTRRLKVWNGGLPDCFLRRSASGTVEPIRSTHLPLGVLSNKDFKDDCKHFELNLDDRLYMWSDGIHEARNQAGEMFGEERLEAVFADNVQADQLFEDILNHVQSFVGEGEKDDDLSLVEVRVDTPENIQSKGVDVNYVVDRGLLEWNLDFEVEQTSFRYLDPLPVLLNILMEVPGLRQHSGSLYTILSELYSNALEHGVLGLDSAMKETPEGFGEYYKLRTQRLEELKQGFVGFRFYLATSPTGGRLTVQVRDSGPGFDHDAKMANDHTLEGYSGRGIPLIKTMCESVKYLGNGNEVEVVFVWDNDDDR